MPHSLQEPRARTRVTRLSPTTHTLAHVVSVRGRSTLTLARCARWCTATSVTSAGTEASPFRSQPRTPRCAPRRALDSAPLSAASLCPARRRLARSQRHARRRPAHSRLPRSQRHALRAEQRPAWRCLPCSPRPAQRRLLSATLTAPRGAAGAGVLGELALFSLGELLLQLALPPHDRPVHRHAHLPRRLLLPGGARRGPLEGRRGGESGVESSKYKLQSIIGVYQGAQRT